jgi:hypothetical protein
MNRDKAGGEPFGGTQGKPGARGAQAAALEWGQSVQEAG